MPEILADILAQRLGRDPRDTEAELRGYFSGLSEGIRAGSPREIAGFGIFTYRDGYVTFEPDERLARAVNHRYESMPAVFLPGTPAIGAGDVAERTEVESESDDRPAYAPPSPVDHDFEATEPDDGPHPDAVPDEAAVVSGSEAPRDESARILEPLAGTRESAAKERLSPRSASRRGESGPRGLSADKASRMHAASAARAESEPSRRFRPAFVLLPLVAAAAIAAFFLFDIGADRPGQLTAPEMPPEVAAQDPATGEDNAPEDTVAEDRASETDSVGEETPAGVAARNRQDLAQEQAAPPTEGDPPDAAVDAGVVTAGEQTGTGFTSDFDRSATGYTLYVASLDDEDVARREIERYASIGLPRAILVFEENGVRLYRVAIGLFDSVESAEAEKTRLGNRIPDGSWTRRIR